MINDHVRNRLTMLKAIRRDGPVARTQLPKLTGLSAGTVTVLTADLVARGLVLEQRDAATLRGRPRSYLSIDADGGVVVAASLAGLGELQVSFVDLAGRLRHQSAARLPRTYSLPALAEACGKLLRATIEASPFGIEALSRIGIALPAIVNVIEGTVLFMTTYPREPTPFARIVADAVGLPVTIENDMTIMARAEHWFGRASALDTFTIVEFGLALGSARYVKGLPWHGANGISPEIGHMKIDWGPEARPCYCGARGCASAYSSMFGMLQAANLLEGLTFPPVQSLPKRFSSFLDQAETDDPVALQQICVAAERLGQTVANHVNAADPGDILILLPEKRLEKFIREPFQTSFEASVVPGMLETVRIKMDVVNPNWRWAGTAALALEQTYLSER